MSTRSARHEGTGILGALCGALLGGVGGLVWYLESQISVWYPIGVVILFATCGAKFGDRFFEWVASKISW